MRRSWNRRELLAHLGAAGIAAAGLRSGGTAAQAGGPNERLNLAIVGCGGQGEENLNQVAGENIVEAFVLETEKLLEDLKKQPQI